MDDDVTDIFYPDGEKSHSEMFQLSKLLSELPWSFNSTVKWISTLDLNASPTAYISQKL